jgi:hypothetical protein
MLSACLLSHVYLISPSKDRHTKKGEVVWFPCHPLLSPFSSTGARKGKWMSKSYPSGRTELALLGEQGILAKVDELAW